MIVELFIGSVLLLVVGVYLQIRTKPTTES